MAEGVHILDVQPFDPDDDTDRFTIEHPEGCPMYAVYEGPNGEDILTESCAVAYHVDSAGIDDYFMHADDPAPLGYRQERVPTGRHEIEAWFEVIRGHEYTEYDGGLRLVDAG